MIGLAMLLALTLIPDPNVNSLPGRYFWLMESGIARVEERLADETSPTLQSLESRPGWRRFPSAILAAAVLYTRQHSANTRRGDRRLLILAQRIGDLLAAEHRRGLYNSRQDHHRDTYMWLDAYRLLERELGESRREEWKQALVENLTRLASDVADRKDYPAYQAPYIITSPNHYALWASTLLLAGRVLDKPEWKRLGRQVMRRFATSEQAPDGYWGEHNSTGPTTGYDYLTVSAVALYWEHTKDPAALAALRRSTDFHKYYTYPDGTPVETINDRNRYWSESMWGHFGFSHFPDGRRYAEFLTSFYQEESLSLESLGRFAQNALYYHEGKTAPIPQDKTDYSHRMTIPAGIRKAGPWVVCFSGIIDTPVVNRFFLDRQGHLSVYHKKVGLIVTGANSKRQPELATLTEKVGERIYHMPISSRLEMKDTGDRLSLAFNSFFAVLEMSPPTEYRLGIGFTTTPTNRGVDRRLTLQLILKAGQALETGGGHKLTIDDKRVELGETELGGSITHNGWTMRLPPGARLIWPVFPFNPYTDGPETDLRRAVASLSVPLLVEAPNTPRRGFYPMPDPRNPLTFMIEVN